MLARSLTWSPLRHRLILALVLLSGAALRLIGLDNVSPPGLAHDEVAHWLINRAILAGQHGLYFTEAYGHEAGYHYVQTGFMVLLGDHALALRLPSAFMGLLLVAVTHALVGRLFDRRTALLATALSAVLFWPVFYSRLALRAIALPLVSGLSAYCWWRGWQATGPAGGPWQLGRSGRWFIGAGLLAGLSLYTYMAARAVPIFYILFFVGLYIAQRDNFRAHVGHLAAFVAAMTLIAAPLAVYLLSNPGAEIRIGEVDAPLVALQQGNFEPVLGNSLHFLAMFGLEGDPLWRQNVAFLPVFEPLVAFFFYAGLLLTLKRWRQPVYLFLILWLFSSALPSIVTIDAPSSIRIINALPIVTVFPVIGLQVIHFLGVYPQFPQGYPQFPAGYYSLLPSLP
ncbi:MAG: glycosyltransferase family 39 protein [Candidatus Promineifilaceae bacterium]|nr:glycosyltransferase family 39 protein [Candidatus Promineifilaceae bacterium]